MIETWSVYFAYGLTDNIDIVMNIPYITASADAESWVENPPPQEEKGFQDGALFVKWLPFQRKFNSGEFSTGRCVAKRSIIWYSVRE